MKRLRFDELILLSQRERSARRVRFHPEVTVIKGENDTGKSSILKSLYATLGADAPIMHPKWKQANVLSSLRFAVDDRPYRMIRSSSRYCLFDENDLLIKSFTSITNGLGPAMAGLFDFHLLLRSKSRGDIQATPAFLFLPFYIDQDAGWTDKLTSFAKLRQFQSPNRDLLHFHFGIKPPGYYKAKARLNSSEAEAQPLRQKLAAFTGLLSTLEQRLRLADFSTNLDAFKEEVERLLDHARKLQLEEDRQKTRMADAYSIRYTIEEQIQVVNAALKELRQDRQFAAELQGESVSCPLCSATYQNGFAERFAIALDEERCIGLLKELDEERTSANHQYELAMGKTDEARELVRNLEQLLHTKREELVLQDLIRSEGRREARSVLTEQISELESQLGHLDAMREEARRAMKGFESKDKIEEIEGYYHAEMTRLLDMLGVTGLAPESYRRIEGKINETGSDLPRAILAFNLASLRTIVRYSQCAVCPTVIDSPRQQDQDDGSWTKIRFTLKNERPAGAQFIIGLANDGGTDFGGTVIELTDSRQVLNKEDFHASAKEVLPLFESALVDG